LQQVRQQELEADKSKQAVPVNDSNGLSPMTSSSSLPISCAATTDSVPTPTTQHNLAAASTPQSNEAPAFNQHVPARDTVAVTITPNTEANSNSLHTNSTEPIHANGEEPSTLVRSSVKVAKVTGKAAQVSTCLHFYSVDVMIACTFNSCFGNVFFSFHILLSYDACPLVRDTIHWRELKVMETLAYRCRGYGTSCRARQTRRQQKADVSVKYLFMCQLSCVCLQFSCIVTHLAKTHLYMA